MAKAVEARILVGNFKIRPELTLICTAASTVPLPSMATTNVDPAGNARFPCQSLVLQQPDKPGLSIAPQRQDMSSSMAPLPSSLPVRLSPARLLERGQWHCR